MNVVESAWLPTELCDGKRVLVFAVYVCLLYISSVKVALYKASAILFSFHTHTPPGNRSLRALSPTSVSWGTHPLLQQIFESFLVCSNLKALLQ
jgi:hypothetical protein